MHAADNTRAPDQPGKAARAECAAAEAEHIDLVAVLIVEGQPQIGLDDVVFQSFAEHTTEDAIQPLAEPVQESVLAERIHVGPDALAVEHNLRDLRAIWERVRVGDAACDNGDVGGLWLAQLLPGAVKTDHETLQNSHPRQNTSNLSEPPRTASLLACIREGEQMREGERFRCGSQTQASLS